MFLTIWDPFGSIWTLLDHFRQKSICCFWAKNHFSFEMVQKGPDRPKRVQNGQKHLCWPFGTLLDHSGMLTSLLCLAIFVCFYWCVFGTPCRWLLPAGAEEPSSLTIWPALKWTCPRPVSIFLRDVFGVFCVEKCVMGVLNQLWIAWNNQNQSINSIYLDDFTWHAVSNCSSQTPFSSVIIGFDRDLNGYSYLPNSR